MQFDLASLTNLLVVGIGVIFLVITVIYLLIMLVTKIDWLINKRRADSRLTSNSKTIIKKYTTDEINPEILAVIAAAVYYELKVPVKIKTLKFLTQPDDTSWSRIGRLSLIESHSITHK